MNNHAERQNSPRTLQGLAKGLSDWGNSPAIHAFHRDTSHAHDYASLAGQSRRFCAVLSNGGVGLGDCVAVLARPSAESIAACLGIFLCGATVLPIDTQFSDEVLEHVIEESAPRVLVTATEFEQRLDRIDVRDTAIYLLDSAQDDPRHWLADGELGEVPTVDEDDVACLFYTSGTTGFPKGVPLTHRNLVFQLDSIQRMQIVSGEARVLMPLPLHHVYPFVIGVLTPLSLGLAIVLPAALTGPQMLRALAEGHVTHVIGVPRLYEMVLAGLHARIQETGWWVSIPLNAMLALSRFIRRTAGVRVGSRLLGSIRRRIGPEVAVTASGGAPLPDEVALELESLGWLVAIGYGLTETAPLVTINPPGGLRIGSVGKTIDGLEVRIAPAQNVAGPFGEVQVRGPSVFQGYHRRDEETRKAFTEDGWFRTGDIGRLDEDGYLYLAGRLSTLIVTAGGENVQPETLEHAYEADPLIKEVGVLLHDERLAAVVLPDFDAIGTREPAQVEERVRKAVEERARSLPSYQRVSDFVISEAPLARTRLGKIQRHILKERFHELRDAGVHAQPHGPMTPEDMSDHDRELIEIPEAQRVWDWLARRYSNVRLTPGTSLSLELDVDSLEWVELSQRVRDLAGVELDEESIAGIDTVRDLLSEVVETESEAQAATESADLFERPQDYLSERQRAALKPLPAAARPFVRLLYHLNRALMRAAFRLEVTGRENLPREGPCIICPNHVSYLDPLVLTAALDLPRLRSTRWIAWAGGVMENPVVRILARLAQAVPIEVRRASQSSLAAGAAVIRRGETVVLFPEGQRSLTGELGAFRPGIGLLASHLDVPLVPAYIHGAFEALPRNSRRLRFSRIRIAFGRPQSPEELMEQGGEGESYERIARAMHDVVEALGQKSQNASTG